MWLPHGENKDMLTIRFKFKSFEFDHGRSSQNSTCDFSASIVYQRMEGWSYHIDTQTKPVGAYVVPRFATISSFWDNAWNWGIHGLRLGLFSLLSPLSLGDQIPVPNHPKTDKTGCRNRRNWILRTHDCCKHLKRKSQKPLICYAQSWMM